MTGRDRPGPPTRSDYRVWRDATTRWSDVDVYGHLNNARYFELIDTAVNAHLAEASGVDVRTLDAIGVVAEVSCRYFREVVYPDPVRLGLAVERLGRASVTYRVGVFQGDGDEAAAEGRFVHVYVDNADPAGRRPVVAVPTVLRRVLAPLAPAPAEG